MPNEAACGVAMSCDESCPDFNTCKHKATASLPACGVAMSCDESCPDFDTCEHKAMAASELNWGPRKFALVEKLHWVLGAGPAEARPCTDGDDDSEYGPRGDDQKCVDEGGGGKPRYEQSDEEYLQEWRDDDREDEEDGYFDDPSQEGSDVPEGYQEVDTGDPDLDPEGGDWEEYLTDEPEDEAPLKKTMKEEESVEKKESKDQAVQDKVNQRTATRLSRDENLGPADYHQFWNQDVWHINQAREILEQRAANPKSPEDAEAVRSLLMNGPKVGGGYEKAGKREPGEPGAEDFYEKEDRSPIV